MSTTFRRIYILLALGAIFEFFGHAMWALRGEDKFVKLVTGTFDNILGISVGTSTATDLVKTIGSFDVVVSIIMGVALLGFLLKQGALYRFALSPLVIAVYSWGVIWGFATAASRMSGAGAWYPQVWDLVERGPNFFLPAALVALTVYLRRHALEEEVERPTPAITRRAAPVA